MKTNKRVSINQWSSTVLNRVANLPQPYRWHFEDWLQQQLSLAQLDPTTLEGALEGLDATRQQGLTMSIQAILQATEQIFGRAPLARTSLGRP